MNITNRFFFVVLCCVCFFVGCRPDDSFNKIEKVKSQLIQEIENFDTIYLGDVRNIEYNKDGIRFSENNYSSVFSLNQNFDLIDRLAGEGGKGPGENLFLDQFISLGDSLFVKNDMFKKIDLFYQNHYLKSFVIDEANFIGGMNFAIADDKIFLPAKDLINLFIGKNMNTDSTYLFGNNISHNRLETHCFLLSLNGKVIYIANGDPIIRLVDIASQKELYTCNYSNINFVRERMDLSKISVGNQSLPTFSNYFADATIDGNTLYVLAYGISQKDESINCNKLICFTIHENEIRPKSIIELDEGYYTTFDVQGNKIVGFDHISSKLKQFSI